MSEQSISERLADKEVENRQVETQSESGESRGGEGDPLSEEGTEDEEGSVNSDRRGKGRMLKAETWKMMRASSLGELGDIRGWVNSGKRKAGVEGDVKDTKVRAVGNRREEIIEKLIENGFKKIVERLDEEKKERNKQLEEMRRESRLMEERMTKRTQELEWKIERLKLEVKAGWEAGRKKESEESELSKKKEQKRKKEMNELKDGIKQMREELDNRKSIDTRGIEGGDRLCELEKWKEDKEREERKNNIMIFGWNTEGKVDKEKVVQLLDREIGVESEAKEIEEVREVGGGKKKMVWVRMKKWEKKKEIMEKKGKLKGKKVFIEHDRTKKEREDQKELSRRARLAKAEGAKNVKLGFGKMWVDGKLKIWDRKRKILVGEEEGREAKE